MGGAEGDPGPQQQTETPQITNAESLWGDKIRSKDWRRLCSNLLIHWEHIYGRNPHEIV